MMNDIIKNPGDIQERLKDLNDIAEIYEELEKKLAQ